MDSSHKTCSACSADVTAAKRFKDSKGRVFCAPCAESLRAKSHAAASSHAPASRPAAPPPLPPREPDDGTVPLADEIVPRDEAFLYKGKHVGGQGGTGTRDLELCPDCGSPWGSSVICTKCGHNRMTGEAIGINVPPPAGEDPSLPRPPKPPKPCQKCGYDLTGLKSARCPECGTINARLKRGQLTEKQTLRQMYLIPLMLTGIGLGLTILIKFALAAIMGSSISTSPMVAGGEAILGYLILFPITIVVGFVVYVACSLMFLGFDEPLGVTFVRLAAVYALTDIAQAIIRPIPIFGWFSISFIIVGIVYVGLLMQLMELDFEDAWFIAVITFIVKLAVALIAAWVIATYF
jgi:hypothetical protein